MLNVERLEDVCVCGVCFSLDGFVLCVRVWQRRRLDCVILISIFCVFLCVCVWNIKKIEEDTHALLCGLSKKRSENAHL